MNCEEKIVEAIETLAKAYARQKEELDILKRRQRVIEKNIFEIRNLLNVGNENVVQFRKT